MPPHFHESHPAAPFLVHPGGPPPFHTSSCCAADTSLGGNIRAECYTGLVIIPGLVPWTVQTKPGWCFESRAQKQKAQDFWRKRGEREALVLSTSQHGSVTLSPTFNYASPPPRESSTNLFVFTWNVIIILRASIFRLWAVPMDL